MNLIKNISYGTIVVSTAVAAGCHFLDSPKLEKMKTAAVVIGLGAAMVYGYLDTVNPKSAPTKSAPTKPAPTKPAPTAPRADVGRIAPQADVRIAPIQVQGTKRQCDIINGGAACTVIAAEALVSMLKGTTQKGSDVDNLLHSGVTRYTKLSRELDSFKEAGNVSLAWDQAYNGISLVDRTRSHSEFKKELITPLNANKNPIAIDIPLSSSEDVSLVAYLDAIHQLESEVARTGKTQGGILIMSPETFSVCITPGPQRKLRYRLFDSHGSFGPPTAAIFEFNTAEDLARCLLAKKRFNPAQDRLYNTPGLYHCTLRKSNG